MKSGRAFTREQNGYYIFSSIKVDLSSGLRDFRDIALKKLVKVSICVTGWSRERTGGWVGERLPIFLCWQGYMLYTSGL